MARLTIEDLHKFYGPTHAVRGVDLDVPEGELAVLVGLSGCGKSTLLRSIAGLEPVDQGTIRIDGEVMNEVRPRDRNIAMVFQNCVLYPYINVYENIAFGLRARRFAKNEIDRRVRWAARMLDMAPLLQRLPRQLSGGQRQLVAIGRALVRDARLFLFDEPLANLDARHRDEMRTVIKRLHQELGGTMIYVTQDQVEAMALAERIVLLRDGAIEQEGAPLELFERPRTRFVAGFLGRPSMNFVPARLEQAGQSVHVRLHEQVLPLPDERRPAVARKIGQEVVFGIRPEHFARAHDGPARANVARLPVTVDMLQPTGSRSYASFALAGIEVMAELQAHDVERVGEMIELFVDMDRAVLIDPASERVL